MLCKPPVTGKKTPLRKGQSIESVDDEAFTVRELRSEELAAATELKPSSFGLVEEPPENEHYIKINISRGVSIVSVSEEENLDEYQGFQQISEGFSMSTKRSKNTYELNEEDELNIELNENLDISPFNTTSSVLKKHSRMTAGILNQINKSLSSINDENNLGTISYDSSRKSSITEQVEKPLRKTAGHYEKEHCVQEESIVGRKSSLKALISEELKRPQKAVSFDEQPSRVYESDNTDDAVEELFKRIQTQRSILGEILEKEQVGKNEQTRKILASRQRRKESLQAQEAWLENIDGKVTDKVQLVFPEKCIKSNKASLHDAEESKGMLPETLKIREETVFDSMAFPLLQNKIDEAKNIEIKGSHLDKVHGENSVNTEIIKDGRSKSTSRLNSFQSESVSDDLEKFNTEIYTHEQIKTEFRHFDEANRIPYSSSGVQYTELSQPASQCSSGINSLLFTSNMKEPPKAGYQVLNSTKLNCESKRISELENSANDDQFKKENVELIKGKHQNPHCSQVYETNEANFSKSVVDNADISSINVRLVSRTESNIDKSQIRIVDAKESEMQIFTSQDVPSEHAFLQNRDNNEPHSRQESNFNNINESQDVNGIESSHKIARMNSELSPNNVEKSQTARVDSLDTGRLQSTSSQILDINYFSVDENHGISESQSRSRQRSRLSSVFSPHTSNESQESIENLLDVEKQKVDPNQFSEATDILPGKMHVQNIDMSTLNSPKASKLSSVDEPLSDKEELLHDNKLKAKSRQIFENSDISIHKLEAQNSEVSKPSSCRLSSILSQSSISESQESSGDFLNESKQSSRKPSQLDSVRLQSNINESKEANVGINDDRNVKPESSQSFGDTDAASDEEDSQRGGTVESRFRRGSQLSSVLQNKAKEFEELATEKLKQNLSTNDLARIYDADKVKKHEKSSSQNASMADSEISIEKNAVDEQKEKVEIIEEQAKTKSVAEVYNAEEIKEGKMDDDKKKLMRISTERSSTLESVSDISLDEEKGGVQKKRGSLVEIAEKFKGGI